MIPLPYFQLFINLLMRYMSSARTENYKNEMQYQIFYNEYPVSVFNDTVRAHSDQVNI